MKGLLAAVLMMLVMMGQADVLWWSVSDVAHLDQNKPVYVYDNGTGTAIMPFLSNYSSGVSGWDDDYNCFAVRVSAFGGGMSEPGILPIWTEAWEDEPAGWADGELGVDIMDDIGGHWGSIYNQSRIPDEATMETLMQMEIGHLSWDDDYNYMWQTIAWSDALTLDEIHKETYIPGTIDPPKESWGGWMPEEFYTINPFIPPVPEPSSLFLALIGSSLLMLKRKVNV